MIQKIKTFFSKYLIWIIIIAVVARLAWLYSPVLFGGTIATGEDKYIKEHAITKQLIVKDSLNAIIHNNTIDSLLQTQQQLTTELSKLKKQLNQNESKNKFRRYSNNVIDRPNF